MKPAEMVEMVNDVQLQGSDVPQWVEAMVEEFCTILVRRFDFYEARYQNRYPRTTTLIEKMALYRTVWVNWDGLEPFPWREERPIKYYFDSNIVARTRDYSI